MDVPRGHRGQFLQGHHMGRPKGPPKPPQIRVTRQSLRKAFQRLMEESFGSQEAGEVFVAKQIFLRAFGNRSANPPIEPDFRYLDVFAKYYYGKPPENFELQDKLEAVRAFLGMDEYGLEHSNGHDVNADASPEDEAPGGPCSGHPAN